MKWIYRIGILGYGIAIWIAARFNPKARLWLEGRRGLFAKLRAIFEPLPPRSVIWIHAASLGEFEQGRPLIEAIKQQRPNQKILLTFFSPSGYEIRKNYPLADYVFYLPLDTPSRASQFINITQPSAAIFIKYEFWNEYTRILKARNIPLLSISALFRPSQVFFRGYGGWYRQILERFDHIFVQNEASLKLLKANGITRTSIAGDTRVDRVWDIQNRVKVFPIINAFKTHKPILIAGSTWQADEAILAKYCATHYPLSFKIIIAPHDIQEAHIQEIINALPNSLSVVRYSNAKGLNPSAADILIIDNIGMLSSLYSYGKWAYIGGAFGKGLHNTLEPIAFGLPVIFGAKYQKFEEARWLVAHQGGFSINDANEFEQIIQRLQENDFYKNASAQAKRYIQDNRGATQQIMTFLTDKRR